MERAMGIEPMSEAWAVLVLVPTLAHQSKSCAHLLVKNLSPGSGSVFVEGVA